MCYYLILEHLEIRSSLPHHTEGENHESTRFGNHTADTLYRTRIA